LEMNINQVETGNFNITGSLTKSVWRAFIWQMLERGILPAGLHDQYRYVPLGENRKSRWRHRRSVTFLLGHNLHRENKRRILIILTIILDRFRYQIHGRRERIYRQKITISWRAQK
jgi:hypothetical protein